MVDNQLTEFDHSAPDCACSWCSSERLTYCLLTRGLGEHKDHHVAGCPGVASPPGKTS